MVVVYFLAHEGDEVDMFNWQTENPSSTLIPYLVSGYKMVLDIRVKVVKTLSDLLSAPIIRQQEVVLMGSVPVNAEKMITFFIKNPNVRVASIQ